MTTPRPPVVVYAAAIVAVAALAASVFLLVRQGVAITSAITAAVVPSLLLGGIGLAARFPCRAMPLRTSGPARIIAAHAASAAVASGAWVLVWSTWEQRVNPDFSLFFGVGVLLYLVTVTVHYLMLEVEASREAEEAALRFQVLAREAELKAFKAQVDPHFLFNSLNAVASLCGSRPNDAREMAQLMADFFRLTLRRAALDRITLAEEVDLVSRYLSIEKVRFGARLDVRIDVDDAAGRCAIPPLLLQPLVENAVRHGIASMVDGGTVALRARVDRELLHIDVENPADPDRAPSRGEGIGLQNARGRLSAVSGGAAVLRATEDGGKFRVEIEMPVGSPSILTLSEVKGKDLR